MAGRLGSRPETTVTDELLRGSDRTQGPAWRTLTSFTILSIRSALVTEESRVSRSFSTR